mmetsp:Transcript_39996/g.94943  ORF Transcript_39996/g.94943 Transcript_39996/m.94943 type:complete len:118 (-) Transcript_39996:29-382(-)
MPSHPAAQGAPNSAPSSQSQSSELGKRPNPEPNNPSAKRNSAQASVPPAQAPPPRSGPTVSAVRHQMDPKRAQEKQRQKQTAVQAVNGRKTAHYVVCDVQCFDNVQIIPSLPQPKPK